MPPLPSIVQEALGALGGLLFEDDCAVCHAPRPGSATPHLCTACEEKLPRVSAPFCPVCGEWFAGQITTLARCSNCADRRFDFDFAWAPLQARGAVRELIHSYKYNSQIWLCQLLGHLLAGALRGPHAEPRLAGEAWTLVPVPLHPRRLRERGFNQSHELARIAARLSGLTCADALRRIRYTTVQATLQRKARLENLRDAFRIRPTALRRGIFQGRAVLLIDDVLTTGGTAQECARTLKRVGGARRVAVLTVARG